MTDATTAGSAQRDRKLHERYLARFADDGFRCAARAIDPALCDVMARSPQSVRLRDMARLIHLVELRDAVGALPAMSLIDDTAAPHHRMFGGAEDHAHEEFAYDRERAQARRG